MTEYRVAYKEFVMPNVLGGDAEYADAETVTKELTAGKRLQMIRDLDQVTEAWLEYRTSPDNEWTRLKHV